MSAPIPALPPLPPLRVGDEVLYYGLQMQVLATEPDRLVLGNDARTFVRYARRAQVQRVPAPVTGSGGTHAWRP